MPKKKSPQIQILGVDMDLPKSEVFEMIIAQNDLEDFADCKFEVKFEKPDRIGTKFVVVETDPQLFKKLIELRKVCVGKSLCPVKDRVRVVRCYKCNRFGHVQKECKDGETCTSCAGPHSSKDCKETVVKCSNCNWVNDKRKQRRQEPIDSKHRADDPTCPQYIRIRRIVESQYDFG